MIMIVILVVGFAAALIGSLSLSALNSARQQRTTAALAQAKDALLGRAVSDDNMPGSLPCPDTNDDGSAELFAGNVCPSNIGRLPWRTLELPDLRDGSGERLWYALSPAFRNNNAAKPLNSDTKGTLLVYGPDGTSLQTQANYSAVAVIFAPGSVVGTQTRNNTTQQNDKTNYLDQVTFPGPIIRNNATTAGPYIAGTKTDTFNDQLQFITTHDLIPLVEQRVAGEVKHALEVYYTNSSGSSFSRYYPWADNLQVGGGIPDYDANNGETRGWLPLHSDVTSSYEWYGTGSPPQWFFDNQWYSLIYYSVAPKYSQPRSSSNTLNVGSTTGVRVLFFMPGTYNGTRSYIDPIDLTQFLQNVVAVSSPPAPPPPISTDENRNADDVYANLPPSQNKDRNRLYYYSGSSWNQ